MSERPRRAQGQIMECSASNASVVLSSVSSVSLATGTSEPITLDTRKFFTEIKGRIFSSDGVKSNGGVQRPGLSLAGSTDVR